MSARIMLEAAGYRIRENEFNRRHHYRGVSKRVAWERASMNLHHCITLVAHSRAPAEYKRAVAEQAVALFLATQALWTIKPCPKSKPTRGSKT